MPHEAITTILSLVAILSATVSAFVSLYVKSAIGPTIVRVQEQEKRLNDRHQESIELWKELRKIGAQIARIEGRLNPTKSEENTREGES